MNVLSFILNVKDELSGGLSKAKTALSSFSSGLSGIGGMIAGAFTFGAITAFTKSIISYGGQIKDAAVATGIGIERFQALSIAAKQNGVDIGTLQSSLGKLRNVQGSIGSEKGVQETFKKIGMSISDVQSANPESLLQRISSELKRTGDASVAFDIFGRSASNLLSTLNELADGWDPLVEKMRQGIISESDIERIDEMGDAVDGMMVTFKKWGANVITTIGDMKSVFYGVFSEGMNFSESFDKLNQFKDEVKKENAERRKVAEDARIASEKEQKKRADAELLVKEQKTGSDIRDESAKAKMTDKEYEIYLNDKIAEQVQATMEDGLSALELQKRRNEAMKTGIELFQVQKKIAADEMREREEFNRDVDKRDKDRADAKKVVDEYRLEQMTPEARLAEMNKRVESKRRDIVAEPDADKAALLIMEQDALRKERDAVKREVEDKKKTADDRRKSLMDSDRELRDMTLTPEQRLKESKAAQQDIAKKLETEKDPDKRFELEKQLREEMKIQLGISTEKGAKQERALSLGDVNDRMRGGRGKRDPQAEANDLARQMLASLKEIEKKKGGMNP